MPFISRWSSLAETFLDSSENNLIKSFNLMDVYYNGRDCSDFSTSLEQEPGTEILDLRSDDKKILIIADGGLFHSNIDTLSIIGSLLFHTDYKIIVNCKKLELDVVLGASKNVNLYFYKVIKYLNDIYDNRIILFDSSDYDSYVINNSFPMAPGSYATSYYDTQKMVEHIKDAFDINIHSAATKRTYLSRRMIDVRPEQGNDLQILNSNFAKDTRDYRIHDESILENFFANNGFEIICPEEFNSIDEQVKYFSNVKILVSATSSGITNSIFMPKGSSVLELATSFIMHSVEGGHPDGNIERILELLHNQYGPLCHILEHAYARVPNYTRKSSDIINFIINNKSIYNFLELGDSNA